MGVGVCRLVGLAPVYEIWVCSRGKTSSVFGAEAEGESFRAVI